MATRKKRKKPCKKRCLKRSRSGGCLKRAKTCTKRTKKRATKKRATKKRGYTARERADYIDYRRNYYDESRPVVTAKAIRAWRAQQASYG
jgi:hypothetical protein